jgi:hypothetical protein
MPAQNAVPIDVPAMNTRACPRSPRLAQAPM